MINCCSTEVPFAHSVGIFRNPLAYYLATVGTPRTFVFSTITRFVYTELVSQRVHAGFCTPSYSLYRITTVTVQFTHQLFPSVQHILTLIRHALPLTLLAFLCFTKKNSSAYCYTIILNDFVFALIAINCVLEFSLKHHVDANPPGVVWIHTAPVVP